MQSVPRFARNHCCTLFPATIAQLIIEELMISTGFLAQGCKNNTKIHTHTKQEVGKLLIGWPECLRGLTLTGDNRTDSTINQATPMFGLELLVDRITFQVMNDSSSQSVSPPRKDLQI